MRSSPPRCRSNVGPSSFMLMALHSICQPGRPFAHVNTRYMVAIVNLILAISDMHDVETREALERKIAADEVGKNERAKIPDMRRVVDGRPAAVHAHPFSSGIERNEILNGTRQGV